jgi:hypothetical protein
MKMLTMEQWDAVLEEDEEELHRAKTFGYALIRKPGDPPLVQVAECDEDLRALLGG